MRSHACDRTEVNVVPDLHAELDVGDQGEKPDGHDRGATELNVVAHSEFELMHAKVQ